MTPRSLKRRPFGNRSVIVEGDSSGTINTGDTTVEMPRIVRVPLAMLLAALLTVGLGWLYFDWFSPKFAPNYRTQFLIDAAAGAHPEGAAEVARSLRKTVVNSGDKDALALRRFGGECGAADNTARLVGFGDGNREEIGRAAARVRPSGRPTLVRGIVQAVEDFSEPFDRKARQVNRIIVVTRHGVDACEDDIAFVEREIRERVGAAGLSLQFRVVGFKVPDEQRRDLDRIATAAKAPPPVYAENATDLDRTLDWFSSAEPVLTSAQRIVDTLNTTVDQVNTAIRTVKQGRLDTADSTLGRARTAVNGTRPEFDDLADRAGNNDARNVNEAADRLRRKQKQVVDEASRVMEAAEAGSPLATRMKAFERAAARYNDEAKSMNKLLTALRGKLTGTS